MSDHCKSQYAVADLGEAEGAMAPPSGPVKISHKKDGHQRQPHRFHVSQHPRYLTTGSATDTSITGVFNGYDIHQKLRLFSRYSLCDGP